MIDAMITNDTIQSLRAEAETIARTTSLANRIRFTVYAWQDEGLPLDEQEARLRKMIQMMRDGSAYTFTFTVIQ